MCDLTDPTILETYTSIVEDGPTNWLKLSYNNTRDVISLYSKGTNGLEEFRNDLPEEVIYGFVKVDERFILITWVPGQVSGVRRARALVHCRSVASLLKLHHAQLTASTLNDLSDENIRTRLKLGDNNNDKTPSRRSSMNQPATAKRRQSTSSSTVPSPTTPTAPTTPLPPPPTSAATNPAPSTPLPAPPIVVQSQGELAQKQQQSINIAEAAAAAEKEEQRRLQLQQEERRRVAEEEEANKKRQQAAQAAAAEQEAKRLAIERQEQEARRIAAAQQEEKRRQEQEAKVQAENERIAREKKILQQRLLEAEKNKDVALSGFVSVQPHGNPFWRRRYFTLKGRSLVLYRDELVTLPTAVLDLNNVIRLSNINVDIETFVPNAFVLETKLNGSYTIFADDKEELQTIMTALQTVINY